MNVANQLYHPYKTIAKMCEERITHIELNAHQSNLNIDFLLLSKTFLPVGVAYKRPKTMVSVDTVRFHGKVSNYF